MWIILNLGTAGYVTDISQSFGSMIGKAIVPIFKPLGLGYWQIIVALIAGIAAKEVVVSSCSVLFGIQNITTGHGMASFVGTLGAMGFGAANAYALKDHSRDCVIPAGSGLVCKFPGLSHSRDILLRSLSSRGVFEKMMSAAYSCNWQHQQRDRAGQPI